MTLTPEDRIKAGRPYIAEKEIKILPIKKKYYIEFNRKRGEERRKRREEKLCTPKKEG